MKKKLILVGTMLFAAISIGAGLLVVKNREAQMKYELSQNVNSAEVKTVEKKQTVVTFGDSIFGNIRDNTSVPSVIQENTNQIVKNVAFGGTRSALLSYDSPWNSLAFASLIDEVVKDDDDETKWKYQDESMGEESFLYYFEESLSTLKNIDFNNVDTVTISYGTNDFTSEVPLEGKDASSFQGSMSNSIKKLSEKYPEISIVVISPAYRYWKNESGEFLVDSDSNVVNNSKLTDFVSMTEKIASDNKLKFINIYKLINADNKDEYFDEKDSTHPNEAGRKVIGEHVAENLIN